MKKFIHKIKVDRNKTKFYFQIGF